MFQQVHCAVSEYAQCALHCTLYNIFRIRERVVPFCHSHTCQALINYTCKLIANYTACGVRGVQCAMMGVRILLNISCTYVHIFCVQCV